MSIVPNKKNLIEDSFDESNETLSEVGNSNDNSDRHELIIHE